MNCGTVFCIWVMIAYLDLLCRLVTSDLVGVGLVGMHASHGLWLRCMTRIPADTQRNVTTDLEEGYSFGFEKIKEEPDDWTRTWD